MEAAPEPIIWPQIWSAAATSVACLLALFGERLRSIFFRPKLEVDLRDTDGFLDGWDQQVGGGGTAGAITVRREVRWYHLVVRNSAFMSWPQANDVRAYITKLEEYKNGIYIPLWELQVPLNFRHDSAFGLRRTLGPPVEVDLLRVSDGTLGLPCELHLQTHPSLVNLTTKFTGPVQLRATVKADSIEGASEEIVVTVHWDGGWHSGATEMQKRHLKLAAIKKTN